MLCAFVCGLFFALSGSYLYTLIANRAVTPEVRPVVYDREQLANGTIYTTLGNQQEFNQKYAHQRPYLLELAADGTLVWSESTESTPFHYQRLPNGTKVYALHDIDSKRWSAHWHVIEPDGSKHIVQSQEIDHTDFHFLLPTPTGEFWVPGYRLQELEGQKVESLWLELQNQAGEVMQSWDSLSHVSLDSTQATETRKYWLEHDINDYFHGNSATYALDGALLISARNTNQIYKVDPQTGEVVWRLGGKDSDFNIIDDPLGGFSHQHTVSQLGNGNILLFDNGNLHQPQQSRVVEYQLDEEAMTATYVWSYTEAGRFSYAAGSAQRLPNGNTFISWGLEVDESSGKAKITEVSPLGERVLEIFFAPEVFFYDAFKL